jgi:3'(2'), 5'-bisphosphate nucleotidase
MDQFLEFVIKTDLCAGKNTEIYGATDFCIETKEDDSLITLADKAANKIITEQLFSLGIPLLSEKGKTISWKTRKNWDTFWLVDPLNGTKEFIKKNGEFTITISLIENGSPILGVVLVQDKPHLPLRFYQSHTGDQKHC